MFDVFESKLVFSPNSLAEPLCEFDASHPHKTSTNPLWTAYEIKAYQSARGFQKMWLF